jgi:LacI family transcriptional regulator
VSTASVKDVALHAGVSVGTVSNVLNRPDKVSRATAERVRRAIAELGYVRNDAARQLRAGRSRAVGLVILDVGNPFFTELARGAEDEAAAAGFSLIVGNSDKRTERESTYLTLFDEQRVQGVLISPVGDASGRLKRLRERGIPVVLVDRTGPDRSFSSVSVDDIAGGRLAVGHLLTTGRRRIAFVGGPRRLRQVEDRIAGARHAVAASETPGELDTPLEVIETAALTIAEGHRVGEALAARDPTERPEAVFAVNDLVAIGLLQALAAAGIRVPDEIALIGYDDIPFARAAVVPLSSVHQPAAQIGASAMRILLDEAATPGLPSRHVVFQPNLVVRDSTAENVADRQPPPPELDFVTHG